MVEKHNLDDKQICFDKTINFKEINYFVEKLHLPQLLAPMHFVHCKAPLRQ